MGLAGLEGEPRTGLARVRVAMVKAKHVPASVRVLAVHLRAHEAMPLVHEAALRTVPKEVTLVAPEFREPLELTDGGSITERRHVHS